MYVTAAYLAVTVYSKKAAFDPVTNVTYTLYVSFSGQ
jgi:hypothetical protein